MVMVLRRGSDKQAIENLSEKLRKRDSQKGLDAFKYGGSLSIDEGGLELQKRLRDEWK